MKSSQMFRLKLGSSQQVAIEGKGESDTEEIDVLDMLQALP